MFHIPDRFNFVLEPWFLIATLSTWTYKTPNWANEMKQIEKSFWVHHKIVSQCAEKGEGKKFNLKFLIRAEICEAYLAFLFYNSSCLHLKSSRRVKCTIGMMSYHLMQQALQLIHKFEFNFEREISKDSQSYNV